MVVAFLWFFVESYSWGYRSLVNLYWSGAGGAALLVVCPVSFLDVCAGTAPRGVRFPRTGVEFLGRVARGAHRGVRWKTEASPVI